MLPPNHCFGGGMIMLLHILYLTICRVFQIFLKQNYHLHLTLLLLVSHITKTFYMLVLGCLPIDLVSSLL